MLVKDWMSRNVITVDIKDSMQAAVKLLREYNIHSLPVMDKKRLVGIVSDGDIKRASASNATSLEIHELLYLIEKVGVKEIMTKNPVTVYPTLTIDEVAEILLTKKISSVPVIDETGSIVGIITRTDILKVLVHLTGANRRGIDFGFEVRDEPGSIKKLTDIIRTYDGRIASILISYEKASVGCRNVFIRVYQTNRSEVPQMKSELFRNSRMLYIIDHLEKTKEFF